MQPTYDAFRYTIKDIMYTHMFHDDACNFNTRIMYDFFDLIFHIFVNIERFRVNGRNVTCATDKNIQPVIKHFNVNIL